MQKEKEEKKSCYIPWLYKTACTVQVFIFSIKRYEVQGNIFRGRSALLSAQLREVNHYLNKMFPKKTEHKGSCLNKWLKMKLANKELALLLYVIKINIYIHIYIRKCCSAFKSRESRPNLYSRTIFVRMSSAKEHDLRCPNCVVSTRRSAAD